MKIHQINSSAYTVEKVGRRYQLKKIVGEFHNRDEAYQKMLGLMNNEISEKDLEREFLGKWSR